MVHSGKFVLRLGEKLHSQVAQRAQKEGFSLNGYCREIISQAVSRGDPLPVWRQEGQRALGLLKRHIGSSLLAVGLFGSYLQGKATTRSDLDLLIVLKTHTPIKRNLYRWWEEICSSSFGIEVSPHFVHIPQSIQQATGFWFEIALNSMILYEKKKALNRWLTEVRNFMNQGQVQRQWSNGHPYWVRQTKVNS